MSQADAGSPIDILLNSRIDQGGRGENAARIDAYFAALKSAS